MADSIDTMLAKTDAELSSAFGFDAQITEFKASLKEASTLSGDARKKVTDRLDSMLHPNIYPGELKYAVASAKRMEANKNSPGDVLKACGCVGMPDEVYDD